MIDAKGNGGLGGPRRLSGGWCSQRRRDRPRLRVKLCPGIGGGDSDRGGTLAATDAPAKHDHAKHVEHEHAVKH